MLRRWKNRCGCCLFVPLAIAFLVYLFWGQRIAADYAYASAYKEIMIRYSTRMQELSARPSPTTEQSKQAQVTALVQRAEGTAKANEEAAHGLKQHRPPEDFKTLHNTTLSLLVRTAQNCRGLAKTIRQSGVESLAGEYDQLEASQKAALGQIGNALNQIRPSTPGGQGIQSQWQTTNRDTGSDRQQNHK